VSPAPLRIYITGATGFVGSEVVRAARRRGHEVVAVVRPASRVPDLGEGCEAARVDLRSPAGLAESLAGVDTVIHLAAAKAGAFADQFVGTVVTTENLLRAMETAGVQQLVGISTFSVYDYGAMKPGTLLDEDAPIDRDPVRRDEYAQTKLIQEDLYRRFAADDPDRRVTIIRPGMIYGADNLWHALLGAEMGPRFLRIGSRATLPLTYVENCAEAMVLAAEQLASPTSPVDGQVINIVDDDLPTQQHYAEEVASRTEVPASVTLPWSVVRTGAETLALVNRRLLGGRAKFPGIAVPDRLYARFKPFRYTNRKAKELLGWSPRYGLVEAIERSVERQEGRAPSPPVDTGSNA
jgi:2-alkyl-3-oxoalkanoate reductase